jgi:hypothetical protein
MFYFRFHLGLQLLEPFLLSKFLQVVLFANATVGIVKMGMVQMRRVAVHVAKDVIECRL